MITKRPLCFLLDPFSAAQQIAKSSPDKIIHRYTAPKIPSNKLVINVYYSLPPGLNENVSIDVQVIIPPGDIYPSKQKQTQVLDPSKDSLQFTFTNNNLTPANNYQYQIRVNYLQEQRFKFIASNVLTLNSTNLSLDHSSFPCTFFTLKIDPNLAKQGTINGIFHTSEMSHSFILGSAFPYFSYPMLSTVSYAKVSAVSLEGDIEVKLPTNITHSTTIGAYNFPQFGSQQAKIKVDFTGHQLSQTVFFQPQGSEVVTSYTFTHEQNTYLYKWNATSIFLSKFCYKIEKGNWSDYFTGNQTITIKIKDAV